MQRAELRVVFSRSVTKSKPKITGSPHHGLLYVVDDDGLIRSAAELRPGDDRPGCMFLKPGTMPRHVAARVLEAVAHEIGRPERHTDAGSSALR